MSETNHNTRHVNPDDGRPSALAEWEIAALDAVGTAIEYWGFKRNQGRIWTLLYLRNAPHSASDIQRVLELSKGAVSMLTRELERWNVVRRSRPFSNGPWHYQANTDFVDMVSRVLRDREQVMVQRVRAQLEDAEERIAHLDQHTRGRVARLRRVAAWAEDWLKAIAAGEGRMLLNVLSGIALNQSTTTSGDHARAARDTDDVVFPA